jgi:hypothetical protein
MKIPVRIFTLLLFVSPFCIAQMETYHYKREIKGVTERWHSILLPLEIFRKTMQNLADIRIYGIMENKDTIEAPFILQVSADKVSEKLIPFKRVNDSYNEKGYYVTFEIPSRQAINQIELDFVQDNYDWKIALEGSENLNEWFTIIENYRILSIKNEMTAFKFSKLVFPDAKYRYFRLKVGGKEKPILRSAGILQYETKSGAYKNFAIKSKLITENKQTKQTEIDIVFEQPIRADKLKIGTLDTIDFYRPITIKYLSDSTKTEKGWQYTYATLSTGIFNSIKANEFTYKSTTLQKLKVIIENGNNIPVAIDSIVVTGYVHSLIARFTIKGTYFLTYGNMQATEPYYDIARFVNNVPESLAILELGEETALKKETISSSSPLFQNKNWLWAIMIITMLLLGWFTLRMMKGHKGVG